MRYWLNKLTLNRVSLFVYFTQSRSRPSGVFKFANSKRSIADVWEAEKRVRGMSADFHIFVFTVRASHPGSASRKVFPSFARLAALSWSPSTLPCARDRNDCEYYASLRSILCGKDKQTRSSITLGKKMSYRALEVLLQLIASRVASDLAPLPTHLSRKNYRRPHFQPSNTFTRTVIKELNVLEWIVCFFFSLHSLASMKRFGSWNGNKRAQGVDERIGSREGRRRRKTSRYLMLWIIRAISVSSGWW